MARRGARADELCRDVNSGGLPRFAVRLPMPSLAVLRLPRLPGWWPLVAGLLLCLLLGPAEAARLALVIGNRDYLQGALKNPVNDAQAMARLLGGPGGLGFDVTLVQNLKRDDIGKTVEAFAGKVRAGDEVLVFYAGHGMQVKGINYLPAVDARISVESDVALNSLNLNELLVRLDEAKAGVRLFFIDACRNNPYGRGFRSGAQGLARVESAPSGTLMHFATRPGGVADDGEGDNGLYTTELLKHLKTPGLPVESMLKRVASAVRNASGGAQTPWSEGALEGEFYFVGGGTAEAPGAAVTASLAGATPRPPGTPASTAPGAKPTPRSEEPVAPPIQVAALTPGPRTEAVPPPAASPASAAAAPPKEVMGVDRPVVEIVLAGSARLSGRFSRDPGGSTYSGEGRLSWPNGDVYEGRLVAGLRDGPGSLAWVTGQRYEGSWRADRPHGRGRMRFVNGNEYEGEIVEGSPSGQGRLRFASGDHYVGEFKDGEPEGRGEYAWTSGQQVRGSFVKGTAQGLAELQLANGDRYTGSVVDGVPNGTGVMTYATKDRYEGAMKDGIPHGQGKYTWASGQWAEGVFQAGTLGGEGRLRFANGNLYQGTLIKGLPAGRGSMQYAGAGDRYVGEFRQGEPHGTGIYTWASGDRYEGAWEAGRKHGPGVFTWANGDRWTGRYERDAQTAEGELQRKP